MNAQVEHFLMHSVVGHNKARQALIDALLAEYLSPDAHFLMHFVCNHHRTRQAPIDALLAEAFFHR